MRFLRARKNNVEDAFKMFKDFIDWRNLKKIDNLLNVKISNSDLIREILPFGFHNIDKFGRPIFINLFSEFKIDRMINEVVDTEAELYICKVLEYQNRVVLPTCSKIKGEYIETALNIVNIQDIGIGFAIKSEKYVKMFFKTIQDFYPENLGKMILINANRLFSTIWSLIQHFIEEKTRSKITVCQEDYLETILNYVEIENLPSFLGGKCKCEKGCINSNIGPWNYDFI